MTFFQYFPRVNYKFGNEDTTEVFENISIYSDVVDQIRDATTAYEDYYIQGDERPDQVSYKLYGTPEYHWTFFLMNAGLRDTGWPLSDRKIFERAQVIYDKNVITTRSTLTDRFKIGHTMTGFTSGATATIIHRDLDLGQVWFDTSVGTFSSGETVNSISPVDDISRSIVINSLAVQYNAAHHYENADKEYVDIDPTVGPGGLLTEITWLDRLVSQNSALKSIKVIRPRIIEDVVQSFREAIAI
jgi:hypothetical protein